MKKATKGLLFTFAALVFISTWPIFLKLGYEEYSVSTTAALWFLSASVYSFIIVLFTGNLGDLKKIKKDTKLLLIFGVLNFISILCSWTALTLLDAGIYAFLFQLSVLVVVFSGIFYLKERFNFKEGISGAVVVLGVLLLSFTKGSVAYLGVILILVHSIGFALVNIIVKKHLKHISSPVLTFIRALMIGIAFLIFSVLTGTFNAALKWSLLYITVPSLFSAVLGTMFIIQAYKYMDMSKTQLILMSQPVIVLIASFFVFGEMFSPLQYFGGVLILGGLAALSFFHAKKGTVKSS